MVEIIIVNEHDEIIGYKERDQIRSENIYRVSALWIMNTQKEILLSQKAFTKKNDPGKWITAVAGTVEKGESYDENIIKEAKEELGLDNIKPTKGPKVEHQGRHHFFCQWYTLLLDKEEKDFTLQKEEVAALKWYKKEELLKEIEEHPEKFHSRLKEYVELFS